MYKIIKSSKALSSTKRTAFYLNTRGDGDCAHQEAFSKKNDTLFALIPLGPTLLLALIALAAFQRPRIQKR